MQNTLLNQFSEDTVWLFNSLNDGILIIDKEARIVFVNNAYCKITNIAYEDLIGRYLRDVRPHGPLPEVLKTKTKTINVFNIIKDIKSYADLIPLFNRENELVGAMAVVKDYGEIEQLAEELMKNKKRVDELSNTLQGMYRAEYTFENIIYHGMKDVLEKAKKASLTDITVLINGESGVGKGVIAEAIHNGSSRRNRPFIPINTTAIPRDLLESELFGYETGAFTGAKKSGKLGLFSIADGGTIFLDEIGDMPMPFQTKLLRVLEDRRVRRIGGTEEQQLDIRIISATNQDMWEKVKKGEFREDLYYRLAIFSINVPPLRERRIEIPVLAKKFLQKHEKRLNHEIIVDEQVLDILMSYEFPGNIRELENCIEYAVSIMTDYRITKDDLPSRILRETRISFNEEYLTQKTTLNNIIQNVERDIIHKYLQEFGNSLKAKKQIAKMLGISLATLYNKIVKYQLE